MNFLLCTKNHNCSETYFSVKELVQVLACTPQILWDWVFCLFTQAPLSLCCVNSISQFYCSLNWIRLRAVTLTFIKTTAHIKPTKCYGVFICKIRNTFHDYSLFQELKTIVYCYAGARVACVSVIQYSEYLLRIFICDIYERTSL